MDRIGYLGGTDIAALFGKGYKGKDVDELWLEKSGLLVPEDISEKGVIKRGNKLEPIVADEFAEDHGIELRDPEGTEFHGPRPWMRVRPDRVWTADGLLHGLEIKTANGAIFSQIKAGGLPEQYFFQGVYYLYVTQATSWWWRIKHPDSWADLDFHITRTPDTDELWNRIIERGDWFMDLVDRGEAPPAKKGKEARPPSVPAGEIIAVTEEATENWLKVGGWLREAQQMEKDAKETLGLAKEAVRRLMDEYGWEVAEGPVAGSSDRLRVYNRETKGRTTYKGKEAVALLAKVAEATVEGRIGAMDPGAADLIKTLCNFEVDHFTTTSKPSKPIRPYTIRPAIPETTERENS